MKIHQARDICSTKQPATSNQQQGNLKRVFTTISDCYHQQKLTEVNIDCYGVFPIQQHGSKEIFPFPVTVS